MIEKEIERMEKYAEEFQIPIMQKEGIMFLQNYIQKNHVKYILEIGSAIGYSAIQMCRMDDEIHVVTIERDEERYKQAVMNVNAVSMNERIELLLGDALETEIEGKYDLIFIDAAKAQYIRFFEKYERNLASGGAILSDNLKFHGMVEGDTPIKNRNTRQLVGKIRRYITYLQENPRFHTEFYDLGDGIAVSKKEDC